MSDNYEKVSLKHASVSKEPELSTITPKSGKYGGQVTDVVQFDVAHNTYKKVGDGYEKNDTEFFRVKVYGDDAKQLAGLVKVGMSLNIDGSKTVETWKDNNGLDKTTNLINANDVALNLSHHRVKSIEFAPKALEAKAEATAKKTMDKPISERAKAEYKPAQKTAGLSK